MSKDFYSDLRKIADQRLGLLQTELEDYLPAKGVVEIKMEDSSGHPVTFRYADNDGRGKLCAVGMEIECIHGVLKIRQFKGS